MGHPMVSYGVVLGGLRIPSRPNLFNFHDAMEIIGRTIGWHPPGISVVVWENLGRPLCMAASNSDDDSQ